LPRDLSFSEHNAIEARSDSEEMLRGCGISVFIQVRCDHARGYAVQLREELRDEWRVNRRDCFDTRHVQLNAITRIEDDDFRRETSGEFRERLLGLRGVEREPLAQFNCG
jgi:hypothetical protein